KKGPVIWFLDPENKTAVRQDMDRLKSTMTPAEQKKMVTGFQRLFHQSHLSLRKEKFLGRDCQVTQMTMNTPNGRIETTYWEAQVGGHSVPLRTLSKTFKD